MVSRASFSRAATATDHDEGRRGHQAHRRGPTESDQGEGWHGFLGNGRVPAVGDHVVGRHGFQGQWGLVERDRQGFGQEQKVFADRRTRDEVGRAGRSAGRWLDFTDGPVNDREKGETHCEALIVSKRVEGQETRGHGRDVGDDDSSRQGVRGGGARDVGRESKGSSAARVEEHGVVFKRE